MTAPSVPCERDQCQTLLPAEYVVGDHRYEEKWCKTCVHNYRLTTPESAVPIRRIVPTWSGR